jgi:hypothetical protein
MEPATAFNNWLASVGVKTSRVKLEFNEQCGWGLTSGTDVDSGDVLFEVPNSVILSAFSPQSKITSSLPSEGSF